MRAFAGLLEKENTGWTGTRVDPGSGRGAGVEVKEELRWRLRGVGGGVIYAFN